MANLSDAYGNITLQADDKETIVALLRAYEYLRYENFKDISDFYTDILESKHGIDKAEKLIKEVDGDYKYELYLTFDGCGRWSYDINIHRNFEWILNQIKKEDMDIVETLENSDYAIDYDFDDVEKSNGVDYHQVIRVVHKKGDYVTDFEIIEGEVTDRIKGNEM